MKPVIIIAISVLVVFLTIQFTPVDGYSHGNLELYNSSQEIQKDESITISGKFTDKYGSPIVGKIIDIKEDVTLGTDRIITSVTTDSSGRFSTQITLEESNRWYDDATYLIYAVYERDYSGIGDFRTQTYLITVKPDLLEKTKEFAVTESFVVQPDQIVSKQIKLKTPYDRINYLVLISGNAGDVMKFVISGDQGEGFIPIIRDAFVSNPEKGLGTFAFDDFTPTKNYGIFDFDNKDPRTYVDKPIHVIFAYSVETLDKNTKTWSDVTEKGFGTSGIIKNMPSWGNISIDEEQNWVLILMGVAIVSVVVGIAVGRSRKKKITPSAKGSTIKKTCRKCGSAIDHKSKFCGKCGVSV